MAGHDLMVHLAIYNDGPFENEQVPAVFGVPLPSSDDPTDPKDLILVGADTWQIKPLSHWPNGSIRWMLVEAIVNVQPNQDRAAFHLTTGQAPEEQPLIASESGDGFVLNTGRCRIRISGVDTVVCRIDPTENEAQHLRLIHLTQDENSLGELEKRTLILENNGPVTATVALTETYDYRGSKLTYTRRCRAYKNQQGLTIESTILHQPWGLKNISVPFPLLKTTRSEEGLLQIKTQEGPEPSTAEASQMAPGSMKRMWHFISLPSAIDTPPPTWRPFLGRAISVNTYNDAACTEASVTAGNGDASLDLNQHSFHRSKAAQYIRAIMGGNLLPTPSNHQALSEWMELWTPEIDTTPKSGTSMAVITMNSAELDDVWRIPSLWYFMTGETIFRDLRLNDAQQPAEGNYDLKQYHGLWDAYQLLDSTELRDSIATQLSYWFDNVTDLESMRKNRHLFRMLANLIHQGGLEQEEQDVWLDRMESLIHHTRQDPSLELNDILFAEAYRLTGENNYLKEGEQWLNRAYEEHPKYNALTGFIQNIQRQHIWRWLEPTVEDRGEEGWELSWEAPRNAVRYRFKQSDKNITNLPVSDVSTPSIPYHAAESLALNIAPATPGTRQTVVVDKSQTAGNTHFAIRYLERGPDLPALKVSADTSFATSAPASSSQPLPKTYADFIMIGLLVIGLGVAFIAWKLFI